MKVTFFGTAAAEGFPALFCECDTCIRARKEGGKSIRSASQALVDDTLLIDIGPDTLAHELYSGLSLVPVTDLIITHSHSDHLLPENVVFRADGYSKIKDKKPLNVYCTDSSYNKLNEMLTRDGVTESIAILHKITPFVPFKVGKYTVIPLKANHDFKTDPVVYLINDGEKTFFYCTDTGYYLDETWKYLEEHPVHVDAMAIDCTAMLLTGWRNGHLGLDTDKEVIDRLKDMKIIDDSTQIIVHHFSHNGGATHSEMVKAASEYGYDVSFDGKVIEV